MHTRLGSTLGLEAVPHPLTISVGNRNNNLSDGVQRSLSIFISLFRFASVDKLAVPEVPEDRPECAKDRLNQTDHLEIGVFVTKRRPILTSARMVVTTVA